MRDALTLESMGRPTALVCTRPFTGHARAIARGLGVPTYPVAVVSHPVGGLDPEGIRSRALEALDQVTAILTTPPGTPSQARHRGR